VRRFVLALGGVAIAVTVALTLPVAAGPVDHADPNDTTGRLDVRVVTFATEPGPLTWRFATFGRWTARQIWDRGYLLVQLDTAGDERIDHIIIVGSDGRELAATLLRVRRDGRQVEVGSIGADKDGPRAAFVSMVFHKLSIGSNRTSFSWSVLTSFTGKVCPRTCFDLVPDIGMVEQPLPGVTPTPTPSPSPEG
jgi:hypothetical protein